MNDAQREIRQRLAMQDFQERPQGVPEPMTEGSWLHRRLTSEQRRQDRQAQLAQIDMRLAREGAERTRQAIVEQDRGRPGDVADPHELDVRDQFIAAQQRQLQASYAFDARQRAEALERRQRDLQAERDALAASIAHNRSEGAWLAQMELEPWTPAGPASPA